MYLKLLAGLTAVFLGLTYVLMAEKAPQVVAFHQQEPAFYLMDANCELNFLNTANLRKHI